MLKIHEIFFLSATFLLLFYNVYKEKKFKIRIEDGQRPKSLVFIYIYMNQYKSLKLKSYIPGKLGNVSILMRNLRKRLINPKTHRRTVFSLRSTEYF